MSEQAVLMWLCGMTAALLFVAALYCIVVSRNLIRCLVGVELLTKAVTLLLVVAGAATGREALVQSLVITLILVEVVVIAVGAGLVVAFYQRTGHLDERHLRELKG